MNQTVQAGSKIRVMGVTGGCCGVIQMGWTGYVKEVIYDTICLTRPVIIVLDDGTLLWEHNVEEIL